MKKILLSILLSSSFMLAEHKVVEETAGWKLLFDKDDFNDEVRCSIVSKKSTNKEFTNLLISGINSDSHGIVAWSGDFLAIRMTFRIDKNEAKEIENYLISDKEEYEKMIESFKRGKILKVKIVLGNGYYDTEIKTISLNGFERLYNLAKTCNYK